jgi:hypothetical protein
VGACPGQNEIVLRLNANQQPFRLDMTLPQPVAFAQKFVAPAVGRQAVAPNQQLDNRLKLVEFLSASLHSPEIALELLGGPERTLQPCIALSSGRSARSDRSSPSSAWRIAARVAALGSLILTGAAPPRRLSIGDGGRFAAIDLDKLQKGCMRFQASSAAIL